MTPLVHHEGVAAPILRDNIDTDAIIPSREMKSTGRTGLADGLFAGWRYISPDSREPNPAFVLNDPVFAGASILLGGSNFGCGSSREHAVWALMEYGIRAVIAPGFAPIFFNNCIRNGLLPASLPKAAISEIAEHVGGNPQVNRLRIDVPSCTISLSDGRQWVFPIEEEAKAMLVEGLDAIDLTLKLEEEIQDFLEQDRDRRPWIYLENDE